MFNISSCTSQDSTAIISSTKNQPSVPSSFSSSSSEKRSGVISTKPAGASHSNRLLQNKPKKPTLNSSTPLKNKTNSTKKNTLVEINENHDDGHKKVGSRKSFSKPSDMIKKVAACNVSKAGVDYITPQESSSRYLLDSTSFLDNGFSESSRSIINDAEVSKFDASSKLPPKHSPSSGISDQVVVLRVSLHCRGCEKKLTKHLSRMPGVTSFNIDFVAKKVTVVGDVTPVQVISSISKVKSANLWSTTTPSTTHISTRTMEPKK